MDYTTDNSKDNLDISSAVRNHYNKYFNYKLQNHNVFYSNKDYLHLGLVKTKTPNGNIVQAYDKERCICDIIKSSNRMDIDLVKKSVKEYLKRKDKKCCSELSWGSKELLCFGCFFSSNEILLNHFDKVFDNLLCNVNEIADSCHNVFSFHFMSFIALRK